MKHTLFVLLAALALNAMAGDWQKHPANPVMGDPVRLGTCFDVNVIPGRTAKYDMYFSWRPNKAIALCSSADGIKWTEPEIVLANDPTSGWEDNLNRSCTVVKDGKYHMWYTGQARGYSKIGYAISDDGKHFTRGGTSSQRSTTMGSWMTCANCTATRHSTSACHSRRGVWRPGTGSWTRRASSHRWELSSRAATRPASM